jgi:hypothetical protein
MTKGRRPGPVLALSIQQAILKLVNQGSLESYHYGSVERLNRKFTFTVLFRDSSTKTFNSQIHFDTSNQKYYLLHENRKLPKSDPARNQKIYADQTINVCRFVTIDKIRIEGVPTDSCWLFKVLSGKINAYSECSEISRIDATYTTAIQVAGDKIEPLMPEKLEQLISGDEKALKLFKRKLYYDAIDRFNRTNR